MGLLPDIPYNVSHTLTFIAIGDDRTEFTVTEYDYDFTEQQETE